MRAHHWDWLHALTFALALAMLGDAEYRVLAIARVTTWPTVQAKVTRSDIDTVRMVTGSRGGYAHVPRRVATYRFDLAAHTYQGTTTSTLRRADVESLGVGRRLTIHYDPRDPARSVAFAPPRVSVWIESLMGIALVVVSGLPWHRWQAHRRATRLERDPDGEPVTLKVPMEDASAHTPGDLASVPHDSRA
jgi:hypothetical protein